jgi:3-hydroxyisobutyrate dehydrogenase-like beta-hydroxyacid dehydrogenase
VRVTSVGILHPGAMGATVGAALRAAGHEVLWASDGRSADTAGRAAEAGLVDAGTLNALLDRAETVLSICPPHAAVEVARGAAGFAGVYVDANAIAPETARAVGEALGGRFVDGGIVGPPPSRPGTTRLYLSGDEAAAVAALCAGSPLEAIVVPGEIGAASAVKATYAAWTKGTAALLLAVIETARAHGVEDALRAEWERSQPGLADRLARAERSTADKAWRWEGEMREIAATFAAAGMPEGFHLAAAELFGAASRSAPR